MSISSLTKPILLVALSAALSVTAFGQAKIDVGSPKFDELQSPNLGGGNGKNFKPKDWLEIEVKLKVGKVVPEHKDGYVDALDVKWFIIVKAQDRKTYRLEKTVKHVNIPIGEEIFTSIYLSPNTLKRITGKDKAGKGDVEAVGGEVHYNGAMARDGFFQHGARKGWWTKEMKGVITTEKFPLLNKDETPFKLFWHDRYAEIAKQK